MDDHGLRDRLLVRAIAMAEQAHDEGRQVLRWYVGPDAADLTELLGRPVEVRDDYPARSLCAVTADRG
jgi:hypothetical protein